MAVLPIGTQGVAAHDLECLAFTIKKGTRVTIVGIDSSFRNLGYELLDVHGNLVIEAGFDSIIPDGEQS